MSATGGSLARVLGVPTLLLLVVANMVGTGVFTTPGLILAATGEARGMLLCWLLGGVAALCGALCYAELGARYPRAGGEYALLRATLGDTRAGAACAALAGWVSLVVGFAAPTAVAALALGTHAVEALVPAAARAEAALAAGLARALASSVVIALTLIHARGVRQGALAQAVLTGAKLVVLLALVVVGLWLGRGDWAHLTGAAARPPSTGGLSGLATGLLLASFAYTGWNAASYVAGEAREPARTLPRALVLGTLAVTALYLLVNLTFVYALPPAALAGREDAGLRAVIALFGPGARVPAGLALAVLLASTIGAMTFVGPRVVFAMAADGALPRALARLDPRTGVPARAVWLQGGLALALVAFASFAELVLYVGFLLSAFSSLTVAGLVRQRWRERRAGHGPATGFAVPGYPATPLVFLGVNLGAMLLGAHGHPRAFVAGAVTLGGGYLLARRFSVAPGSTGTAARSTDGPRR